MKAKEEGNHKEQFIIRVGSEFQSYLLMEVALSRGLDAWLDQERDEICMCGSKEAVRSILQATSRASKLLRLRQFEGVAEALRSVNGTPSTVLMDAIATAKFKAGLGNEDGPQLPLTSNRFTGLN